VGLEFNFALMM